MVAEFWPGWFDHWGEQHHKMEVEKVAQRVSNILRMGASINFYMFHGKLDTASPINVMKTINVIPTVKCT